MENKKIVSKTIKYIESNLECQLSLAEIAKNMGYSKFHLNRIFLEYVGCTIYKYIQQRRLTIAAEKLVYSEKPIIEIAYEANYNSQQSFTYAFSSLYGFSPQKYRIMKVHTPKRNEFKAENKLINYKVSVEYEGFAA